MHLSENIVNIISARNPRYVNEEGTAIDMLVKVDVHDEELPFTATSYDSTAHGKELYARAINGELGPIAPYEEPEETE